MNGIIGRAHTKNIPVTTTSTNPHWKSVAQARDFCALLNGGDIELRSAGERDERQREGVDGREALHRLLVDDAQHVRARRDAGHEVPRQVRQAERGEQLDRQRPREKQKADRGDRPKAPPWSLGRPA